MWWGNLGDITSMLQQMPNLEELHLYGNFSLSAPLLLERLKTLSVSTDSLYYNIPQQVSNTTMQYLLGSQLGHLTTLELVFTALETDEEDLITFDFNDAIVLDNKATLQSIFVSGKFRKGTFAAIENAVSGTAIKTFLHDLQESD